MQPLHFFLIDDHPLFRSGLRLVLESGVSKPQVHEMASIEETMLVAVRPDLVLLDIYLAGINGLQGIALLKRQWPESVLVVVSSDNSGDVLRQASAAGAHDFISKAETPAHMLERLLQALRTHAPARVLAAMDAQMHGTANMALSERQGQVLALLGEGLSNRAIGQRLFLSEHTIRWHVQGLLETLGASSRTEAVFLARRKGLIK